MKAHHLLSVFIGAVLSGCATHPLGLSKAEWNALSPRKQAEYFAAQRQASDQDRRYAQDAVKQAETFRLTSVQDNVQR